MLFDFGKANVQWYPAHMKYGLDRMHKMLRNISLILEALTSRHIPFTSANPILDRLGRKKHRIVIFNKTDLADPAANARLAMHAAKRWPGRHHLLTANGQHDYKSLLGLVRAVLVSQRGGAHNAAEGTEVGEKTRMLVVGVPNVGKSTVINRLRALGTNTGGKAVKTGGIPGITKSVSGIVRILNEPPVYMLDTPGVLVPKISSPEMGLKLALTGAIMDQVVEDYLLADYLLYTLNYAGNTQYLQHYALAARPTDLLDLIEHIGRQINAVDSHGFVNKTNAISHFLRAFRKGVFGRFTLDCIPNT